MRANSYFKMTRPRPWEYCVIGCGLCFAWAILAPLVYETLATRRSAGGRSCLSNMKQLSLAIMMYATDYDDHLPEATHWMDLTYPYVMYQDTYKCPGLLKKNLPGYGYAFHRHLSQKPLPKIKAPATVIMLFESNNLAYNATDPLTTLLSEGRHEGQNKINIGFADGHAKAYLREEIPHESTH